MYFCELEWYSAAILKKDKGRIGYDEGCKIHYRNLKFKFYPIPHQVTYQIRVLIAEWFCETKKKLKKTKHFKCWFNSFYTLKYLTMIINVFNQQNGAEHWCALVVATCLSIWTQVASYWDNLFKVYIMLKSLLNLQTNKLTFKFKKYVNKKRTLFVCAFHVSYNFFNAQKQGRIILSDIKLNKSNLNKC